MVKLVKKWPWILPIKYLIHTPQVSLMCLKILWHGTNGFTSPLKKLRYRFLSPFKIHRPWPVLNLRTLGPMEAGYLINILTRRLAILTEIFHGLPQSLQEDRNSTLKLGHDCFLPNPFQFIIHVPPYHSTLHSLSFQMYS
jgi:hypothetical protein